MVAALWCFSRGGIRPGWIEPAFTPPLNHLGALKRSSGPNANLFLPRYLPTTGLPDAVRSVLCSSRAWKVQICVHSYLLKIKEIVVHWPFGHGKFFPHRAQIFPSIWVFPAHRSCSFALERVVVRIRAGPAGCLRPAFQFGLEPVLRRSADAVDMSKAMSTLPPPKAAHRELDSKYHPLHRF